MEHWRSGMKQQAMLALVILLMTVPGISQDQIDPARVLQRVAETYRAAHSYHFEATIVREMKSQGIYTKTEFPIVVAAIKPDRMRMEIRSAAMNVDILAISNGRTIWEYLPRQKEYTKRDVAEIGDDTALYFLMWSAALGVALPQYEQIVAHRGEARFLRDEAIVLNTRSIDCYVIQAEYDSPVPSRGREPLVRTYWIDKLQYLVLKEVCVANGTFGDATPLLENTSITTFSVASVDQPLSESMFVFTRPEGANEVKRVSTPEKRRQK